MKLEICGCRMILWAFIIPSPVTDSIAMCPLQFLREEYMPTEEALPCPSKETRGTGEIKYEV